MSLPLKLLLSLAACAMAAVLGAVGIAALMQQQANDGAVRTRDQYLLDALRDRIQASLGNGHDLAELPGLQAAIERELVTLPDLMGISIYSADGHVRYSTDRALLDDAIPTSWTPARRPGRWCAATRYERTCGTDIPGADGVAVGGLAVTSRRTSEALSLQAWIDRMPSALGLSLLAAALAALGGLLLAFLLQAPLRRAGKALTDPPDAPLSPPPSPGSLASAALDARQRHHNARAALTRDLAALQELDDAA